MDNLGEVGVNIFQTRWFLYTNVRNVTLKDCNTTVKDCLIIYLYCIALKKRAYDKANY